MKVTMTDDQGTVITFSDTDDIKDELIQEKIQWENVPSEVAEESISKEEFQDAIIEDVVSNLKWIFNQGDKYMK